MPGNTWEPCATPTSNRIDRPSWPQRSRVATHPGRVICDRASTGGHWVTTDLLRAVVGAIQDVAIICDADYLVLAWNRAAEALFGVSAADALGHPLDKLPGLDVSPLARRAIRQLVDR